MAGCDQSTGAEPQLSCDENEPPTATTVEQVSYTVILIGLISQH